MNLFRQFQNDIRIFLALSGMSATGFSIAVTGDRNAVGRWLAGHGDPKASTMQKVYDYIHAAR